MKKTIKTILFMYKKNKTLLVFCLFFALNHCFSQTLIPYLGKNGLYGYADENGKLIIETKYNKAAFFEKSRFFEVANFAKVEKANEKLILFRDGTEVPCDENNYVDIGKIPNYIFEEGKKEAKITTLDDVVLFATKNINLINTKLHKKVSYPLLNIDNSGNDLSSYSVCHFTNGVIKVTKAQNKVNFIGEDLNEIFKEDVFDGKVGFNNYITIVDENKKQGIAKTDGTIVFKPTYYAIEALAKDGFFKIKKDKSYEWGVIDINGKMIIDTIYQQIDARKNYIFASKRDETYGKIFNYEGTPNPNFQGCILQEEWSNFTVIRNQGISNVYDENLQKQIKETYESISLAKINTENQLAKGSKVGDYVFIARNKENNSWKNVLYDSNFKIIFSTSKYEGITSNIYGNEINDPDGRENHRSGLSTTEYDNTEQRVYYGIVGFNGKELVPAKFESVYDYNIFLTKKPIFKFFETSKNDLKGLYSFDGKLVLPCQYKKIDIATIKNDTLICAKKGENTTAEFFNSKGKKITTVTKTMLEWKFAIENYRRDYDEITTRFITDTTSNTSIIATKTNIFQVITDEKGKNIVPEGYVVLDKLFKNWHYEKGFLAVVKGKIPPPIPPPSDEPEVPLAPAAEQAPMTEADYIAERKRLAENYKMGKEIYDDSEIGLIDFTGKWIVPLQKVVDYGILNRDIIIAKIFKECYGCDYNNILFRPNLAGSKPTPLRNYYMKNGVIMIMKSLGKDSIRAEVLDEKGNELTKGNYQYLEAFGNFAFMGVERNASGKSHVDILNKKGEFLFDASQYSKGLKGLKNHGYVVTKGGLTGTLDSLGKVVIPLKYKQVMRSEAHNRNFFAFKNEKNEIEYLDDNGNILKKIDNPNADISTFGTIPLPEKYFLFYFQNEKNIKTNFFLNEKLEFIGGVEGDVRFEINDLPKGLVQVTQNEKIYYYDYLKNIFYKD